MDKDTCVIYSGSCFTVEWYYDADGYSQAFEYFLETTQLQKRKFLVLVKRIADVGRIFDITKYRNEGDGIFAFKPQPDRYLSFFVKERKIIVTNGFSKRTRKMPKSEKMLAINYMNDYYNRIEEK